MALRDSFCAASPAKRRDRAGLEMGLTLEAVTKNVETYPSIGATHASVISEYDDILETV